MKFDRELEFSLGEIQRMGSDEDVFDNIIESKAGEIAGVLADFTLTPVAVRNGNVVIRVVGTIEEF